MTNFLAVIDETGSRILTRDRAGMLATFAPFASQEVVVTVEPLRDTRSNAQNRYYFGVVVPAMRAQLSIGREVPLSKEQTHEILKGAFIGHEITALGSAPKESKNLTTEQFVDYVEAICSHAASEFGLNIPQPNEY